MEGEAIGQAPLIEWGVAGRALPGQAVSGDLYLVQPFSDGVLVAVVDGLGHGEEAAVAARCAVSLLRDHAHEPVEALLSTCHMRLRRTRGVVMSLASIDAQASRLSWAGVGNVEGVLLRTDPAGGPIRESLAPRGGVVGSHLPSLHSSIVGIATGDTLIFATDGIRTSFIVGSRMNAGDSPREVAQTILAQHGKETDDALVLVARYRGRRGERHLAAPAAGDGCPHADPQGGPSPSCSGAKS